MYGVRCARRVKKCYVENEWGVVCRVWGSGALCMVRKAGHILALNALAIVRTSIPPKVHNGVPKI